MKTSSEPGLSDEEFSKTISFAQKGSKRAKLNKIIKKRRRRDSNP
jgi:hypothetical protein